MAEINDLDVTDASNIARFPEGQAPSSLNNGARALEGLIARWHKDGNASVLTTGILTAYGYAANQTLSAYYNGLMLGVDFHVACGASPTINVDSLGAKALVWPDGTALVAGDISIGQKSLIVYDGTSFQVLSSSTAPVTRSDIQNKSFAAFNDTGAVNAYVITPVPAISAYAKYQTWIVDIANANTGASTMNINGLGVRNIFDYRTGAALIGQEMRAGLHTFVDDGTQLILMNPVSKLSVNFFAFDETTDVSFTSNVPTGTVFSSSQNIIIPTKGLLRFSFHGRIINNSGATLPFHIGIRVNGVDYWPHADLNGVTTYHQYFTLAASNYREIRGAILVTQGQQGIDYTLDIEGQGIATGLQTVQPVIAVNSGATSHTLQGVTTTARFKLAVEDYS